MVPVEKPRHGTRAGKSGDTLQAENQMLRNLKDLILDSTREGIIGLDPMGKINLVNPAAAKMLSYEAEELLGRQYHTTCHHGKANGSPYPEEESPILAVLAKGDTCWQWDAVFWRKDGTSFPAEYSCYPILEHGKSQGGVLIFRDTTAHKRLEDDLLREKTFSEMIINLFPGIFFLIDEQGRLLEWNENLEKVTGYSAAELAGMHTINFFAGDDKRLIAESTKRVFQGGEASEEVDLVGKDGSRTPYFFTGRRVTVDNANHKMGVGLDLTERKQLEKQLLHAQKMEAVGRLAGGVAHDFNNILTAILGNIGLAALDEKIGPRVQDRLAQAEAACLRAQALSQQLLTFAKGGAPVRKLCSVAELLTESTVFACVGSPVRCETTFPENLWWIEADPGQIDQVFQNLTINAVQAMPIGGTIKVWAENLTLGTDSGLPLSAGRYIKISLRDQGMGIPAEHLPRIFDPYFTTKQKGSGLGLASVYAIIEKHHGHIGVESKPGVGTTFYIYFPAVEGQVTPQPEEDKELLVGTGKILVMDDEEMVREVLGGMLALLGYEAEFARDGGEAIEMFVQAQGSGQAFAAVILDLTVPGGMGGKETMARLREIDPQVKAVVSSGYSDDPIMADFQKYGFSGVIAKPYRISELGKILLLRA